ncbi:MAG: metal-sulfur cluster assembly factor [Candidatus Krumholzibacteriia bacterium]
MNEEPRIVEPTEVLDALRPVKDPELDISIVDLGLIRGIAVEDDTGQVRIDLTLTSPMCPLGPEIMAAAKGAAEKVEGVNGAEVQLVWSPPWDPRVDCSEDARAELGIWD